MVNEADSRVFERFTGPEILNILFEAVARDLFTACDGPPHLEDGDSVLMDIQWHSMVMIFYAFFKGFFPQTVWPHYGVLTVIEKHLV